MKGLAVLTDSSASFPKEWYDSKGLHVVQLGFSFKKGGPLLEFDMEPKEFYCRMREGEIPKTSTGRWQFQEAYDYVFNSGAEKAVVFTFLKEKSSTYSIAVSVAQEHSRRADITVIDTHTVGPAQGFIAAAAKRFSELHGIGETVEYAQQLTQQTAVFTIADNPEYLKQGGRVDGLESAVAATLRIRPIISIQKETGAEDRYTALPVGRARGMGGAIDGVIKLLEGSILTAKENGLTSADVKVIHADNETHGRSIEEKTSTVLERNGLAVAVSPVSLMTPVLGTHFGPGAVGVSVLYR